MKILDRYILKTLLESYLICILIVLSFYIVIDLFVNLDKFTEYTDILRQAKKTDVSLMQLIAKYYLYHSPLIFYNLSPMVTLMAAMFTVTRMVRSNELIPLKACGVPIYRALYPFVTFAILVSLLMVMLQEIIIPQAAPTLELLEHVKHGRKMEMQGLMYRDSKGRMFYVGVYHPPLQKLENIRVTIWHDDDQLKPRQVIEAKFGGWRNIAGKRILFLHQGTITSYALHGGMSGKPIKIPEAGYPLDTDLRDSHLTYPEKKNLDKVSSQRLRELIQKSPNLVTAKVALQTHFSLPLSNILLLFLGVPLMLRQQARNFFLGTGLCVIIAGCFYGCYILCLNLGYKEILTPIFAAWFPTITFGSLGISFLAMMHT